MWNDRSDFTQSCPLQGDKYRHSGPVHQNDLATWCRGSQPLYKNVDRFRCGLVFKAHRLLYHPNLGLRVIKKKKRREHCTGTRTASQCKATTLSDKMRVLISCRKSIHICIYIYIVYYYYIYIYEYMISCRKSEEEEENPLDLRWNVLARSAPIHRSPPPPLSHALLFICLLPLSLSLFLYLSLCLTVSLCLSLSLSLCLPLCVCVCLSLCLSLAQTVSESVHAACARH